MNTLRGLDGVSVMATLVFTASAVVTISWCGSMAEMPGMQMPGGWTMSMAWMRMPDQTWLDSAGAFIGMWAVMMIAMMMPVFVPEAVRFRRELGGSKHRNSATLCLAAGYFAVWILAGIVTFPLGVAFAKMAMRSDLVSSATPLLGGFVVTLAGGSQFTGWKLRQLACCRHEGLASSGHRSALRAGARLALRCVYCCAGLTAVLLVIGVMDLRAMALVTAAISAERLMAARASVARLVGAVLLVLGGAMVLRAVT